MLDQFLLLSGKKLTLTDVDRFYYDAISYGGRSTQQLPVRSLVGLIPLYAVLTLEPELINKFPSFRKRLDWFIENRQDVAERNIASMKHRGKGDRLLLSLVSRGRLEKILKRMLDETEFLSEHGIRSMSKYHEKNPVSMEVNGQEFKVSYVPGDSDSALFGGNSNWRGPVWLCVNFLLVESLLRFYMFYGDSFQVECPTGSGDYMHLGHIAEEIQHRLQHLFARNDEGRRAVHDQSDLLDFDEHWKDYMWFNEFFDGDTGRGLGSSHQCGWTGLIAKIIHDTGCVLTSTYIYICPLLTTSVSTAVFHKPHGHHPWQHPTTSTTSSPVQADRRRTDNDLLSGVHRPAGLSEHAVTLRRPSTATQRNPRPRQPKRMRRLENMCRITWRAS